MDDQSPDSTPSVLSNNRGKGEFVHDLCCPECRGRLTDSLSEGKEALFCPSCGACYFRESGVYNFAESSFDTQTGRNFGYSWLKFPDIYQREKADFLEWIHPVQPEFFQGKRVLDAGCGNGLHARMAAEFGASEVMALDLSPAVAAARINTRDQKQVKVLRANLYRPPLPPESFDYVYSIGVIQHLPDREGAIRSLSRMVRPGGALSIWVYGYEGTGLIRYFIEPPRKVICQLPPKLIYLLSIPPALGFYGVAKAVRALGKLFPSLLRHLPLGQYFNYMASFPFRYQFNTVFDQLVAPRSYFFKKSELQNIFSRLPFDDITITSRNGMSWRVFAKGKKNE